MLVGAYLGPAYKGLAQHQVPIITTSPKHSQVLC